jgi:magnesium chelatase family protein
LTIAVNARLEGFEGFILPKQNAREAGVVDTLKIYGVETLQEVIDFMNGDAVPEQTIVGSEAEYYVLLNHSEVDFSDVEGQENVKRALEIAAAGERNILIIYSLILLLKLL